MTALQMQQSYCPCPRCGESMLALLVTCWKCFKALGRVSDRVGKSLDEVTAGCWERWAVARDKRIGDPGSRK